MHLKQNATSSANDARKQFLGSRNVFFSYCGTRRGRGGQGVHVILHTVVISSLALHPYKAGTEHAGVSPDQARNQSPSAKRRDAFGKWHEG
ncbi:unnamed protein product [Sphacelaria rigidula]